MEDMRNAKNIIELVYSLEPICYYFDMKPEEFWNATYRSITQFIRVKIIKMYDDLKREINLYEALTNKLIMADGMSSKNPKIVLIRDSYKQLFKEVSSQKVSSSEILRRMRLLKQIKEIEAIDKMQKIPEKAP